MTFDFLFNTIGVNPPDRCFEQFFHEAVSEYQNDGVFFLSDKHIDYVNSFNGCLSNCLDQLKRFAQNLRGREAYAIYLLFLRSAMKNRALFMEHIESFVFPESNDEAVMLLPFFALLPEIPMLYEKLKKRSVPDDIIAATLRQFEDCIYLTKERTGKLGYLKRYFDHMQLYVDERILNIGRLRFEMVHSLESHILVLHNNLGENSILFDGAKINCAGRLLGTPPDEDNKNYFTAKTEETEAAYYGFCAEKSGNCTCCRQVFPKDVWHRVLKAGDSVLSVHIPNKGALTNDACRDSFQRAQSVFSVCYPEFHWKAFHCHSWMLDPQLRVFLSESSNILAFQRNFTIYAGETKGQDVFNFVFKLKFNTYQDMPEDTSLQRALKKHYLNGKYLYEYEGIFFP